MWCAKPERFDSGFAFTYSINKPSLPQDSALERLVTSGLMTPYHSPGKPRPILSACEAFFIHDLKYILPAKLEELARRIPTSYATPSQKAELTARSDPMPVWPYGKGEKRRLSLKPLYPSVPESVSQYPDPLFYELLVLIDAIRSSRAREKQLALQKVTSILKIDSVKR